MVEKKKENKNKRIAQAKEYIKKNVWRRFLKYKVIEIIVIPLTILSLWKIPLWIGWAFVKLMKINPETNTWFCVTEQERYFEDVICKGGINNTTIWLAGFLILGLIIAIISVNWYFASKNVKEEAHDKYELNWYDIK